MACPTTTGTTILPVLLMKKPYSSYMLTLEEVVRGEVVRVSLPEEGNERE